MSFLLRSRSHRFRPSALAGLLVLALTTGITPVASAAESATPAVATVPPAADCGGDNAQAVTAEAATRFADLWKPRVLDEQFAARWVDEARVSPQVAAEGFHELADADERFLSSCLLDALLADGGPQPQTIEAREQLVATLQQFVFDPAAMRADSRTSEAGDPVVDSPVQPEPEDGQGDLAELRAAQQGSAPSMPPLSATAPGAPQLPASVDQLGATAVPLAELATLTSPLPASPEGIELPGLDAMVPAARGELLSSLGGTAAAQVDRVRGLAENVVNTAGGLVDGLTADQLLASLRTSRTMQVTPVTRINLSAGAVPPLPQLPIDPLAPVVLPPGLPSVTYRLCAESATLAASCSLPLPLGVPYVADVTGDGSFDVLADLLPGVDTGALTTPVLRLLNRRLPTSEFQGRPLAAHVFVVYDLPQASRRVALGYDGFRRGTTLPEMTDTTYTLDLPAARDAVLDVRAVATHTAPGTSFANTFGFVTTRTDQSDVDPTAVSVQFSPVPTTYSARLRRAQSGAQTLIETALERSSRLDAIAVSDRTSTSPSPRSATQLVVADMPRTARLEVLRRTTSAGEAEVAAAVATSSDIARLDLAQFEQPDRTSVADYTGRVLSLTGVPASLTVAQRSTTGRSQITYDASARLATADAADVDVRGGELVRALVAGARSLPTSATLTASASADRSVNVDYRAAQTLPALDIGYVDRAAGRTVALGQVRDLPTAVTVNADVPGRVLRVDTDSRIGSLDALVSQDDGGVFRPTGEHATVVREGRRFGGSLRITGVQALNAGFDATPRLSAQFSPGGQPFLGAGIDDEQVAVLSISDLPSGITTAVDPAGRTATYRATTTVRQVDLFAVRRDRSRAAVASLQGVPTEVDLAWTFGSSNAVTYRAASRLGSLSAGLLDTADGGSLALATLQDVPTNVRIVADRTAGRAQVQLDGRLGLLSAAFQRAGAPVAVDARDHVTVITRPGGGLGASLRLHGLRGVDISYGDDRPRGVVTVEPGGRPFVGAADLEGSRLAVVDVSALPSRTSFTVDPAMRSVSYDNSAPVARLAASYVKRSTGPTVVAVLNGAPSSAAVTYAQGSRPGLTLSSSSGLERAQALVSPDDLSGGVDVLRSRYLAVDVGGLPASVTLDIDTPSSRVAWNASAPVTRAAFLTNGLASLLGRPTLVAGALDSVPASWDADFGGGSYRFRGLSGPIGSVDLALTNRGTLTRYAGPHLAVQLDQPRGLLDASLVLPKVSRVAYTSNGGTTTVGADVDLGATPLVVDGDARLSDGNRYGLRGTISGLPSTVTAVYGNGKLTYSADRSVDVALSARGGRAAALEGLGVGFVPRGVAVVDGGCGSGCSGLVATANVRGLPRTLTVDAPARSFSATGLTGGSLQAYADLDNVVATPVLAYASLSGLPSALDLTVGPLAYTRPASGPDQLEVGYSASAPLGRLEVFGAHGAASGYALVDRLPARVSAKGTFGAPTDVRVEATAGIAQLVLSSSGLIAGRNTNAFVSLTDVPSRMTLTASGFGTAQGIDVPRLGYAASASTLDGTAFVDKAIVKKVAGATADVGDFYLAVADLAAAVNATVETDKSVLLTSSPATGRLALGASMKLSRASKDLPYTRDNPLCTLLKGFFKCTLVGRAGVDAVDLDGVVLSVSNLSSMRLRPGPLFLALGVSGNYGQLVLTSRSVLIDPDVDLTFRIERPFGLPDAARERLLITNPTSTLVFRVSDQAYADIRQPFRLFLAGQPTPVCLTVKAQPRAFVAYTNGVVVNGSAGAQVLNYLNPGGQVPGWILDALTGVFSSPFDKRLGFGSLDPC